MRRTVISLTFAVLIASSCATQPKSRSPSAVASDFRKHAEIVQKLDAQMRSRNVGGTIDRVRWSADGLTLYFTHESTSVSCDLETGGICGVSSDYDGELSLNEPRRGRGGFPGRGRQSARATSPNEQWVAVCEDWNVVLRHASSDRVIRVTSAGHRKLRYGTASWVYGEELDQNDAMWWSPDSKKLAFYEFDERHVQDFYLIGNLTTTRTTLFTEGYPKAGEPNPIARLMVYDLDKGSLLHVATAGDENSYIYNVSFSPRGDELVFSHTNRHQNVLTVMAADVKTGSTRVILTETQDTWQENRPAMRFLRDGTRFIWETERTGWKQFELRSIDGELLNPLTRGKYPAASIIHIDERNQWLYYSAYSDANPLNVQLHRVRLDGSGQQRLTPRAMNYTGFSLSPKLTHFIARFESVESPPRTALYDMNARELAILATGKRTVPTTTSELFSCKAADGTTDLYGVLHKPTNFRENAKYPLIVDVYGGPHLQRVQNRFTQGDADCEYGFVIAVIDNRGTPNRGKVFESATYLKLGSVDLADQVAAVQYLCRRPYVDATRIGIVGHSYGGYMAALGILKHPEVFHAAVARAAVTDWRQYDTIYTERYMQVPEENSAGYDAGSCLTYADKLRGHLLIMHGMMDDNVHPNNAWALIDALDKAGKNYESRFFPNAQHGFGGTDTQWEFFYRHLIAN